MNKTIFDKFTPLIITIIYKNFLIFLLDESFLECINAFV